MARLARAVATGAPASRDTAGHRRQATFFSEGDYRHYRDLLATWCTRHGVAVWAWYLMPNHAHLVLVPAEEAGPRRALVEAHRRYMQTVNRCLG